MRIFMVTYTHISKDMRNNMRKGVGVYCDYAAATPIDRRVSHAVKKGEAMYANPSSLHREGVLARQRIDGARENISHFFHALPDEIIFTSGGTEGNAISILGTFEALPKDVSHYHAVTTAIEHPSVLEAFRTLEKKGLKVTYVAVDESGHVSEKDIKNAIRDNTMLVSVMHTNNEIGTIQPIADIGRAILKIRKERTSPYPLFHVDACQSAPLLPITAHTFHADLISISFAKLYGPKGVGALYVRRGVPVSPFFPGGSHERGLRPGTENLSGIVGAEEAARITEETREKEYRRLSKIHAHFLAALESTLPRGSYRINGSGEVSPHIANISFLGCDAEEILFRLDVVGISVGTKSACQSEDEGLSYVVKALGDTHDAGGAVRFSFGRNTTKEHINHIVREIKKSIAISSGPIN